VELTQQEMREEFLDFIIKENKVSLKSIYDCLNNKKDEIDNMDGIFDSDDEPSIKKRLVLLKLISREHHAENVKYYQEAKNDYNVSFVADIDKYKVVLITALMFNTVFYISACNWCGLIQREVSLIKEKNIVNITEKANVKMQHDNEVERE